MQSRIIPPIPIMSTFNTITMDKKYVTRSGDPVKIISTEARGNYSVLGYIGDDIEVSKWTSDGRFFAGEDGNDLDIFEDIPKTELIRAVYVNDNENTITYPPKYVVKSPMKYIGKIKIVHDGRKLISVTIIEE